MNYEIIKDESIFREFINWLPELTDDETFYVCLFARSKYCSALKNDKQQLKRFTSTKSRLFEKVKQLECAVGSYTSKGAIVPQEALALYITPNPRSISKANVNTMVKIARDMQANCLHIPPHQIAMSEIQKAKSRTCFIDFDLDCTDSIFDAIDFSKEVINPEAVHFLRTRGGMHFLVDPQKVNDSFRKTFYTKMKTIPKMDQSGDMMIPVPGCTQGGFTPHFLNSLEDE